MYTQFRAKIAGPTLIMHNGQTADPLNGYAKLMKSITGNRKKTDADYERLARIEYEAGLYLNSNKQVILPSRVIEAALVEGAKTQKQGQQALAGLFVDADAVLEYAGGPLTVEKLINSEAHRLCVPVVVGQAKTMRTRPMFADWSIEFLVSINTDIADERSLRQWIEKAGGLKGLGDWRPRYGRFELKAFAAASVPANLKVA
jgi:hypothetical protein